jgi:uncharacterized protein YjiS (DUF1127 family)
MAYINDVLNPGLGDRLRAAMQHLREVRTRRALFNQTVAELSALSNRDLADLGIARTEIRAIARTHAYGA